jgi:Signal recognition particle GTPase
MSQLHPISGCDSTTRKADVIFVHGLGGDAFDTWRRGDDTTNFWPEWLGQDFTDIGIWSLGYASSPTKWARIKKLFTKEKFDYGHAMPLPDRARQVLDLVLQNGLGNRPMMFICHSLGGLLVKQILRISLDTPEGSSERALFENTRAVLFLATPHNGADLATLLSRLRIAFPTVAVNDLIAHNAHLRDLFEWYRVHASEGVQTRTYNESRSIGGVRIVDPTSAHPGVGPRPVLLDDDHISIAKLLDRNSQVYVAARELIRDYVLCSASSWSFHKDIRTLSKQTKETMDDLSELSRLRDGGNEIKINRHCVQKLRNQVEERSLVIVGDPGAGKSGAIHDLGATILQEGRDIVVLAVDRIDAENEQQLKQQLGLQNDLNDILLNWGGDQPAFVLIDALDAARSDRTAQLLLYLLARIVRSNSRWRVVASIRKFDLRHNRDLRNIFSGQPPIEELKDPELLGVCHIKVPAFSEEELSEVAAQSPELQTLLMAADHILIKLLQVPFNLRLMAELLGEGVSGSELTPIKTQLELLDRYWEERVIQPSDGMRDAREDTLRRAASQMVKNRILHVSRAQIVIPETSRALDQILSEHVLIEWQPSATSRADGSNLTFSHHVLFDYAVERLLLRNGTDLTQRLASEPEMIFVIRPSLDLHFQHLWSLDKTRSLFWELVLKVMQDTRLPEVGKLIGPVIAAESSVVLSDLKPLLLAIEEPLRKTNAEATLRHVVGGLLAMSPDDMTRRIAGPAAGPWAALVEYLSQRITNQIAYIVRTLLTQLCERTLSFEQQYQAGVASRNLLEFSWSQQQIDEFILRHAIKFVCRTYQSNPDASGNLLRLALHKEHLAKNGYVEIPVLAQEAVNSLNHDPAFVRDLYIAAFNYIEMSEDETALGGGILPLKSNRRQDYSLGLYQLSEDFGNFIEHSPVQAVEALISIIEQHVISNKDNTFDTETDLQESFEVGGMKAVIYSDNSAIWDSQPFREDELLNMMDTFQAYFAGLGKDPSKTELRQQLLYLLVTRNRMAALWRRVLICGTKVPETIGMEIRSMGWALPVLMNFDTSNVAGDFLRALYGYLSLEDRERVERNILLIPSTFDIDQKIYGEKMVDRLLGCLPPHFIYTPEAGQRVSGLIASGGPPENNSTFRINVFDSSDSDCFAEVGVPVDDIVNLRIQELERPVELFTSNYQSTRPTLDAVRDVLHALQELWDAISNADATGVNPKQKAHAWVTLVEACANAAKCADINCNEVPGAFLLSVLLEASKHPEPRSSPEDNARFEKTNSWIKPAIRVYAARGLADLTCHPSGATKEILVILENLLTDSAYSVRYQVAIRLINLYETANVVMWSLINRVVAEESSQMVLNGLVNAVLGQLAGKYPDEINEMLQRIFERANVTRVSCVQILTGLFLWQGHEGAGGKIQDIIGAPVLHSTENRIIVAGLRDTFTKSIKEPANTTLLSVRSRSWNVLLQMLNAIKEEWRILEAIQKQSGLIPEQQQQAQRLGEIIVSIATAVYFTSGASNNRQTPEDSDSIPNNTDSLKLFFGEAGKVLDILADFPIPRVTHYLMQTLEHLVPVDPVGVFLRIGNTIVAGKESGYQYESLAADLVVKLVERYLAEFSLIFRDNTNCLRTLMQLLDVFVHAGWPSAHRLTYRLGDIYR